MVRASRTAHARNRQLKFSFFGHDSLLHFNPFVFTDQMTDTILSFNVIGRES
jgi:hypothetical protein